VRVLVHEPAEVVLEVTAPDSAYLVLTDNYYPDWVARVNGAETDIMRAYHTFRAVVVPPGTHEVSFRFEPRSLRIGMLVSLAVGLAVLAYGIGLGWVAWRRRPAARETG
jgi:uncharacterized membrane protein YfhO